MTELKLTSGLITKVDDEDYAELSKHSWGYITARNKKYVARTEKETRKTILLHRQLLNFPSTLVDHINEDTFDNQKHNLRRATRRLNALNVSKFNGVRKRKNRYNARTHHNGKDTSIGNFNTFDEARTAYKSYIATIITQEAGTLGEI
jgi:hypothetical protein